MRKDAVSLVFFADVTPKTFLEMDKILGELAHPLKAMWQGSGSHIGGRSLQRDVEFSVGHLTEKQISSFASKGVSALKKRGFKRIHTEVEHHAEDSLPTKKSSSAKPIKAKSLKVRNNRR